MIEIDARGLPRPGPLVKIKPALEQTGGGTISILVDNSESCRDIERFAQRRGCSVTIAVEDGAYRLDINKEPGSEGNKIKSADVVLITSNRLGGADARLGGILMSSFLNSLWDADTKPGRVILVNEAVKLATEGSEVLDTLRLYEVEGVDICSCGTCLDYFQLRDKLKVGRVTSMPEIVSSITNSGKTITI